jgi:hypothetical protein
VLSGQREAGDTDLTEGEGCSSERVFEDDVAMVLPGQRELGDTDLTEREGCS